MVRKKKHNLSTAPDESKTAINPVGQAFRASNKAEVFEKLARSLAAPEELHTDLPQHESDLESTLLQLVADVGTGLWRLRSKGTPLGGPGDAEEDHRTQRNIESILDTLVQAGVEIRDHTGELVPRGGIYALNVLVYEPKAGLATERVIETIKPTIYFQDRVIQVGQVIIGTPMVSENQAAAPGGSSVSKTKADSTPDDGN